MGPETSLSLLKLEIKLNWSICRCQEAIEFFKERGVHIYITIFRVHSAFIDWSLFRKNLKQAELHKSRRSTNCHSGRNGYKKEAVKRDGPLTFVPSLLVFCNLQKVTLESDI